MRTSHHCDHEVEFVRETREMMLSYMDKLLPDLAKLFRVRYQQPTHSPSGLPSIYIDGPEEFLEHGEMVFRQLDGIEPKLSLRKKFDVEGMTEIRGKKKIPFLWPITDQIVNNTSYYLSFRMRNRGRFLTDLPGETLLLDGVTEQSSFGEEASGLRALNHALPLISELQVDRLIKIRMENRDSFAAYRSAISAITKKALEGGLSIPEAGEVLISEIEPAVGKMRKELSIEKRKQTRRFAVGGGSIAAGLTLGAIAGLAHVATPAVAAVAGLGSFIGGNLIRKAADSACEHGLELEKNNDLYFVLQLLDDVVPADN